MATGSNPELVVSPGFPVVSLGLPGFVVGFLRAAQAQAEQEAGRSPQTHSLGEWKR